LGLGGWGLAFGPNPQSPIPNPQSPIPNPQYPIKLIIIIKIDVIIIMNIIYDIMLNYIHKKNNLKNG
jgi:hypothetical protein